MRIEEALPQRLFTLGQFEIVTLLIDRPTNLDDETTRAIEPIASRGLVLSVGDEIDIRPTPQRAAAGSH